MVLKEWKKQPNMYYSLFLLACFRSSCLFLNRNVRLKLCIGWQRSIFALKAVGWHQTMCNYQCFHLLVPAHAHVPPIRGSWGLSRRFIPCRFAWSDAFIGICSCRPSITTTACERRPVSERLQLKAKVVFVRSCQTQSETGFALSSALPLQNPCHQFSLYITTTMSPHSTGSSMTHISCGVDQSSYLLSPCPRFYIGACREHVFFFFVWHESGLGGGDMN